MLKDIWAQESFNFQCLIDDGRYPCVVVHALRDSANLSTKVKYLKIFNCRLIELTDNVDTKNANPSGTSGAMLVMIPLPNITALIEYLWI